MLKKCNLFFKIFTANIVVFASAFAPVFSQEIDTANALPEIDISFENDVSSESEISAALENDVQIEYETEILETDTRNYQTLPDGKITPIAPRKKRKTAQQERYEKSSVAEKTIHDITNYGIETKNPYNIENYRAAKTDVLSEQNLKIKERVSEQTKFYIALQGNVLLPDSFDLKEPKYFGAAPPTVPLGYESAEDFLPNGNRSGTYEKMSSKNAILYPYVAMGIRTNNNFRFELAHMQSKFKLQNDKGEGGISPPYLVGYNVLTGESNMDFDQKIYLLNGYVDLKFNRAWVYFGAGIGMVNNQLKNFYASIENAAGTETYIFESLTDSKAVYKTATMLTLGTYFKIFENAFVDIGVKKISADKVSTLKDYNLTKITNATNASITTRVSMNLLQADIDPYLISIGFRYEF